MNLHLYHRWTCPHSAKVRNYIIENDLTSRIQFHELDEEVGAINELRKITGKEQVPCLVIEGKPMLESSDIIQWMKDHLSGNSDTISL